MYVLDGPGILVSGADEAACRSDIGWGGVGGGGGGKQGGNRWPGAMMGRRGAGGSGGSAAGGDWGGEGIWWGEVVKLRSWWGLVLYVLDGPEIMVNSIGREGCMQKWHGEVGRAGGG